MTRPADTLPAALSITRNATSADATVSLSYEDRFLRRKVLVTDEGSRFLVNLDKTHSMNGGDAFLLEDGRRVAVIPAAEDLLEITGPDLIRLAWHIGNRHTPCQIEPGRLVIRRDHVLKDMLGKLGAQTREICEPFTPEGGAYGMGRTHGHSH